MRKNLGAKNKLYPMPLVVIGTVAEGKNHYMLAGHVGIIDHGTVEVSIHKSRYSQKGLRANQAYSINLLTEDMLPAANQSAFMNGWKEDKSNLFEAEFGAVAGAPLIKNAPVSMACQVIDIYERPDFDIFIARVAETLVDEKYLQEDGSIDYAKMAPVMFVAQKHHYVLGTECKLEAYK
jgi:flavin reductase (DIM6/NTAB) family NADH-FMN oxidoreductase RutF